ncbi:DUF3253 domain-containing protein [Azorhizobium sp. AG788]|uniref:DUF3253 domain-containing protein n=1 Tax=Azorhizobium sp. AG788 TaxID=2183897 RepID=UPI00313A23B7
MTSERAPDQSPLPAETDVEQAILDIARQRGDGKTIDPSDPARALSTGDGWQRVLPLVRRVAVRLAQEGRLIIYRKGKPVDPSAFRGVYRLGLPRDE